VQLLRALEPLIEEPASEAAPMPIREALAAVTALRKMSAGSAD
jgi:hypothetical protein